MDIDKIAAAAATTGQLANELGQIGQLFDGVLWTDEYGVASRPWARERVADIKRRLDLIVERMDEAQWPSAADYPSPPEPLGPGSTDMDDLVEAVRVAFGDRDRVAPADAIAGALDRLARYHAAELARLQETARGVIGPHGPRVYSGHAVGVRMQVALQRLVMLFSFSRPDQVVLADLLTTALILGGTGEVDEWLEERTAQAAPAVQ